MGSRSTIILVSILLAITIVYWISIVRTLESIHMPILSRRMVIYQYNLPQVERKEINQEDGIEIRLEQGIKHELKFTTISTETVKTETVVTTSPQANSIPEKKETKIPTSPVLSYPDNRAIVIIGCSRMEQMKLSILNVFALSGIEKYSVYLSLGCPESVNKDSIIPYIGEDILQKKPVNIIEFNDVFPYNRGAPFLRIHRHYIHIFHTIFEVHHHSHVLLLEDDLLLSPSTLDFIQQTSVILDKDPTLLCVSLFNDNAFAESDSISLLRRGSQFPNLGMFFNRRGYQAVWNIPQITFTTNGWDHWLRSRAADLHLECVFPAVPRVRHQKLAVGTTVRLGDKSMLHTMPYVMDKKTVKLGDLSYLLHENYDRSIANLFADKQSADQIYANMQIPLYDIISGKHTYDLSASQSFSWEPLARNLGIDISSLKVLSGTKYSMLPSVLANRQIKAIVMLVTAEDYKEYAQVLRIANSPRCVHKGVTFLQQGSTKLFMLDRRIAWYLMPIDDAIFYTEGSVIVTTKNDETCNEVCNNMKGKKYVCNENQLQFLNSCSFLQEYFPCEKGCGHEVGQDLPGYVNFSTHNTHQYCLFSSDVQPLCDYSLPFTQRLCVCSDKSKVKDYGVRAVVTADSLKAQREMHMRKRGRYH